MPTTKCDFQMEVESRPAPGGGGNGNFGRIGRCTCMDFRHSSHQAGMRVNRVSCNPGKKEEKSMCFTCFSGAEAMSSYPDLDNAYAKCKFKRYTRDGRPIPCLNARCPNPLCRRKGAEKHSIINQRSVGTNPPKWCVVLRVDDKLPLDIVLLNTYLGNLFDRFRYYRKSTGDVLEYASFTHYKNQRPHTHLSLIAPDSWTVKEAKAKLKEWWRKSCDGRKVSVYVAEIRNVVAKIKYVTGDVMNREKYEKPPRSENGKRSKLVRISNGYLSGNAEAIWKEHIAELYPNAAKANFDARVVERERLREAARKAYSFLGADGNDSEPIAF